MAVGIGFGFARIWALPLAALPLPGIWYARATGPEYWGDGGAFWFWPTLLIAIGAIGIVLGVSLHRWSLHTITWHGTLPPPTVEILLLTPALAVLLLSAALDLADDRAFLRSPHPIEVRRYSDDQLCAEAVGLPFTVYGAPASEGSPSGAIRRTFAPPGLLPTETYILIYCDDRCRRASEMQIESAPPRYHQTARTPIPPQPGTPEKTIPPVPFETVEIAGVSWHVVGSGPLPGTVSASADLGDASVKIHAPSRAHLERVAVGLRRITTAPAPC